MKNKSKTLIYIALFSGLGLFSYLLLVNYTYMTAETADILMSFKAVAFFMIAFNILGYVTIRLSAWINNRYSLYVSRLWKIVSIYSLVALMLMVLNYGLIVSGKLFAGALHPFTFPNGGTRILVIVLMAEMVIIGLIIANEAAKNALRLQRQAAELQEENNKANYAALQNQLNPHFLFNSLNTLIAEIEYDPKTATVFTRKLSDVYRYVLQCQNKPLVTLGEELEFGKSYLFLHEVRLGRYINWHADIPTNYIDSMLPPLTLQLLIENAIKHNSITASRPIDITLSIDDNTLIIKNSKNPKKSNEPSGIGLQNLDKRSKLISGNNIIIINDENYFTVKIPLIYE